MNKTRLGSASACCSPGLLSWPPRSRSSTPTDSGAGSLRQAIVDANGTPAPTRSRSTSGARASTRSPGDASRAAQPVARASTATAQSGSTENTDPVATNAVLLIELDGSVAEGDGPPLHVRQLPLDDSGAGRQPLGPGDHDPGRCDHPRELHRNRSHRLECPGERTRHRHGPEQRGRRRRNDLADRNLVSGNAGCFPNAGIRAQGTGTVVEGNLIGTDAGGTVAIPNCLGVVDGIGGVTIGGAAAGAGNIISGNTTALSLIQTVTTIVHGNRMGTTADGTGPLGNGRELFPWAATSCRRNRPRRGQRHRLHRGRASYPITA